MNVELIDKALELVGDKQLLINIVSKRVQQLNRGADPYVPTESETGNGDVALMEILQGKIIWREMTDNEISGNGFVASEEEDPFAAESSEQESTPSEPEALKVTILSD